MEYITFNIIALKRLSNENEKEKKSGGEHPRLVKRVEGSPVKEFFYC